MRILVTGGAGFLGSHLCERLVADGHRVTVLDSFDPFYPRADKEENLHGLGRKIRLDEGDIRDPVAVERAFKDSNQEVVVHLAARAGVRPSLADPVLYHEVNSLGTVRVLEASRKHGVQRFIFASSSSIYGAREAPGPCREDDPVESQISPYGATKRAGEQHVRVFSRLHGFSAACLRFFTAYGPRQRPDMAIHKFALRISRGKEVPIFGTGDTAKDYTYVGDIVEGIALAVDRPYDFEVINLGGGRATKLSDLPEKLSRLLCKPLRVKQEPLQPGDVMESLSDIRRARAVLGWQPKVGIDEGLERFVEWFNRRPSTP